MRSRTGRATLPGRLLVRVILASSIVVTGAIVVGAGPSAAAPEPTVRVEQQTGAAGPVAMVILDGWPFGQLTVSVCGADAHRGSADCDVQGSHAVTVPGSGSALVRLPPLTPPIGCPCVVRVTTPNESVVRTLPIVIPGQPMLTPDQLPPDPNAVPPASQLEVDAQWQDPSTFGETLVASLGGPAHRDLVVTVHNAGPVGLAGLSASAGVGPDPSGGEPIAMPAVDVLAPGERHTYRMAVTLPVATYGTLIGAGQVRGLSAPVTFRTETTHVPWGFGVVLVIVVALVAVRVVRKRRRRRRPRAPSPVDPRISGVVHVDAR